MHSIVCGTGTPNDRDEVNKLKRDAGSMVKPEARGLSKRARHQRTVSLVLVVSQQETVVLVRLSRNQSTGVHVIMRSVGVGRVLCVENCACHWSMPLNSPIMCFFGT